MSNPSLFFEASQGVAARLGELFNFAWPAAAALWNLRWQVIGFAEVTGKREVRDLHARFVDGSGITSANLKAACLESTWEQQQEQFARFLLFELCSLYEGWLEDVVPRVVPAGDVGKVIKNLQFPSVAKPKPSGLKAALAAVNAAPSAMLKAEFLPALILNPKNSWGHRESLIKAYRYFKECRNALMHGGGRANQACLDARAVFVGIPIVELGFKTQPRAPVLAIGGPVVLALPDVVGLASVVHRLIVTLDAALAVSAKAERELLDRVKSSAAGQPFTLSTKDSAKRERQIVQRLRAAWLPKPIGTAQLDKLLVAQHLIA